MKPAALAGTAAQPAPAAQTAPAPVTQTSPFLVAALVLGTAGAALIFGSRLVTIAKRRATA